MCNELSYHSCSIAFVHDYLGCSEAVAILWSRHKHRSSCPMAKLLTRRSVEHCTPHADGAPLHFTGLSYIFRMIKFYLFLAECGRGSISLQSPVTYQVETDQCKRRFESVMPTYLYSF